MTDHKPGTVAVATVRDHSTDKPEVRRVTRFRDGWALAADPDTYWLDRNGDVTEVRPLVLLDLDDYSWLPNRLRIDGDRVAGETGRKMHLLADQIDAQICPPKPAEPTGLGAVVEDAEGRRWVFTGDRDAVGSWWLCADDPSRWPDIAAVRVLSEGVTA
jgi:hypothetical protein